MKLALLFMNCVTEKLLCFSVKTLDISENAIKVNVLKQISGYESAENALKSSKKMEMTGKCKEIAAMRQETLNLKIKENENNCFYYK